MRAGGWPAQYAPPVDDSDTIRPVELLFCAGCLLLAAMFRPSSPRVAWGLLAFGLLWLVPLQVWVVL